MKIAVVSYKYNLSNGSMTNSLLWNLAEKGDDIHVFTDHASIDSGASLIEHERLTLNVMEETRPRHGLSSRVLKRLDPLDALFARMPMSLQVGICSPHMACFSGWLRERLVSGRYDLVLAIEARSLATLHWCDAIPTIYVNMELLGWEKDVWNFPHKQLLKQIECKMLQKVAHVLITSPARGDIFARINDFPRDRITALPVVPMAGAVDPDADFFRKKFGIPEDKRILLYAGHLVRWAQCGEIVKSVAAWPDDCVLVLHTWSEAAVERAYLAELHALAEGLPVYFSFENISYAKISDAWASADIGLAFYQEIDSNFTEILFSSNKFGEYMKAGLPVICSPLPSLSAFVAENGVGCAVPLTAIDTAIETILADFDGFKVRVANCHQKFFVFERYFDEAYPLIQRIAREQPGAASLAQG